ncbi:MAG: glycosyltransferase [Candidatus Symbiobacter sp.]|nr:glycosyltransferase [Candidatus Symbiobacter sp.]
MRVDVVVPNYNKGPYIREALLSILRQKTDKIASIIVCDDGSTDNSIDEVRRVQAEYPGRVTLIKQLRNVGGCRNTAFAFNQGMAEFVAALDGDDTWDDENKVELMVAAFDQYPELLVCTSMWSNTNMVGERFTPDISQYYPDKFYRLSTQDLLSTPAVFGTISFHPNLIMMRRNVVASVFSDAFNAAYFKAGHADSFRYPLYKLAESGRFIGLFTEKMANLRVNETSFTTNVPHLMYRYYELLFHCNYRLLYLNNTVMDNIFDYGINWVKVRFVEELEKSLVNGDKKTIEKVYKLIIESNNQELIDMFELRRLFGEKIHVKLLRDLRKYGVAGYLARRLYAVTVNLFAKINETAVRMYGMIKYILVRILRIPIYIGRIRRKLNNRGSNNQSGRGRNEG